MQRLAIFALVVVAACDDTTPLWELDNDRIVAVRATPPRLVAGERAALDVLVTATGVGPSVRAPVFAAAVPLALDVPVPPELAAAVVSDGGGWAVVCPDDATLSSLRTTLGLDPTDPIPLLVGITIETDSGTLPAVKSVFLGEAAQNPILGEVTVNGMVAFDGMTIPPVDEVPLSVPALDTDDVDWLTSVGELTDQDDPEATLVHDPTADPPPPIDGHLAVVLRDERGGVAWSFWTIAVR
jgi:hypothetical protein